MSILLKRKLLGSEVFSFLLTATGQLKRLNITEGSGLFF